MACAASNLIRGASLSSPPGRANIGEPMHHETVRRGAFELHLKRAVFGAVSLPRRKHLTVGHIATEGSAILWIEGK